MRLPPAGILADRQPALRAALDARGLDALVVTSLPNIAYLTGFFASAAALLVTPDGLVLIADSRYQDALHARARDCGFIRAMEVPAGRGYDDALVEALARVEGLRVGFEAAHVTVARSGIWRRLLAACGWRAPLLESTAVIEELRVRKDAWEVARLREGAGRLSEVAKCILPKILAGRTEAEIAAEIESALRHSGFERPAFDTIVASGPNAALPHARAGQRRIGDGDLVVVDFGGVLDGYCSDLTRTVIVGQPGPRARRLIEVVVEAQHAAFAAAMPGGSPEAVDRAARDLLTHHGVGEAFTHGTGHGLGLEVHEAPRVTRGRADHAEPPLAPGMVMTLEPGVYFPGEGGVRIEDDVLVTGDGAEWLTDVPRIP